MSPVQHTMRLSMRADTEPTPSHNSDGGVPTRVHIKQDTVIASLPTSAVGPAGTITVSLATASDGSASPPNRGMSGATKIGLAMIPVVVMLVGLYILFLFWHRKRQAARKSIWGSISPPVPEKDLPLYNSSTASRRRSSKVFQMSAFSTPIYDGCNREAQFLAERACHESKPNTKGGKAQAKIVVAPLRSPHMGEADLDSPIDANSPFRLKRGDTVKRCSLGPELARLWPSPPTSAWMRPLNFNDELPAPVTRRESSVYQERPIRNTT